MDYKGFQYENHLHYAVIYAGERSLHNQCSRSWEYTERAAQQFWGKEQDVTPHLFVFFLLHSIEIIMLVWPLFLISFFFF